MKTRIAIWSLLLASLIAPLKAAAEDIDLFVGRTTSATDAPNVLIILDNTANWGPQSKFQAQKDALVAAFNALPDNAVNVGLMMYTETGGGNSNTDGGYVRAAIRPLDATYKAAMEKLLVGTGGTGVGLNRTIDASNSGKSGLTMAEAYLYFLGGNGSSWEQPWAGNAKNKTDYTGNRYQNRNNNPTCCLDSWDVWDLPGNALGSKNGTQYNSPVDPNSCADNFIIFIGNGPASDSSRDSQDAQDILEQMPDVSDIWQTSNHFQLTPSNSEDNMADEWAYFMYNDSPLEIVTFGLDVNIVNNLGQCTNGTNGGWSAMMENMSKLQGGGEYYPLCSTSFDADAFEFALFDAFNKILSRNSVFASVALPAAANEQSTFLNQVFVGVFRPDAEALPRWKGNLKQFQIAIESNDLKIVDADGDPLVDTTDTDNGGFIDGCARSFWTPTSESSPYYWDYLDTDGDSSTETVENCTGQPSGSNTPDGGVVEKGGQAYTLRATNPLNRTFLTCDPTLVTCNGNGLVAFSAANIPAGALDPNDAADRTALINWAIGYDEDDEDGDSNTTEMRMSAHGDIVHAQPVALDYAQDPNNPEVVVFYGGNDGVLRAINGNQASAHGSPSASAGHEFWAYLPPEFYLDIKRLRLNEAEIEFPASGPTEGAGSAGDPKGYGMDGPLTAYALDTNNDGAIDERVLFAGVRRGGRLIYSFDVTNRNTPSLNWKIGCPNLDNDTGCTVDDTTADGDAVSDWLAVGQTWSKLLLMYAEGYDPDSDGEPDPLIVTGGGYDDCEDLDDGSTDNNDCSSTKGNLIYVLDADTGAVVNWFATDRSVPGNVVVVPVSDDDPSAMFIYAADMGGNVYRISGGTASPYAPAIIGSTDPANWIITKIASLGCDNPSVACSANRKFLFGPDVIKIPGTDKIGILIGSGDREKPLTDYSVTYGVGNYFYSLVDQPTNASWLDDSANPGTPCNGNDLICHDALTTRANLNDGFDATLLNDKYGFKMLMRGGEQVVTGSITVDNVVNFSTHIPVAPGSCDAEYGVATAYNVNYADGSGDTTEFLGGGLVPTPVAGKVIIDGVIVPFCIGCGSEGSPIGAGQVGGGITWTQPRSRIFWNTDQVDN